jgi:histidinol-phosphatase (PHP family)
MTGFQVKTNYHTHTLFCDGRNSAEEMVAAALERGIEILGFSAHALFPFASWWHLPVRDYGAYAAEISRLKEKYAGRITILMGYEADYLPPASLPDRARYSRQYLSRYMKFDGADADFLIGSVHYAEGGAFCVDGDAREVAQGLESRYGGDAKKFVRAYYESVRAMIASCDFDIVGHIDVIRKRNGVLKFFDEREDWYAEEIEKTAKAAGEKKVIVEINTGGMAHKVIDDVYPSQDFLTLLKKYAVPVTINSDAHDAENIDHSFDFARECARKAGYTETVYLTDGERRVRGL